MRLTVYTDYSLRVLMYVALHPERQPTIGEIASSYGISRNHLMKVVYELGLAGTSSRCGAKNGGLRLARPPQGHRAGARVVRRTEPTWRSSLASSRSRRLRHHPGLHPAPRVA
jgi:Rrf2 family nitric oxide-sensitive transcriptional repressor